MGYYGGPLGWDWAAWEGLVTGLLGSLQVTAFLVITLAVTW